MSRSYKLLVFLIMFGAGYAQADEGYDPVVFDNENDANNLYSFFPPIPPKKAPSKTEDITPTPPIAEPDKQEESATVEAEASNESDNVKTITETPGDVPPPPVIDTSAGLIDNLNSNSDKEPKETWIDSAIDALKTDNPKDKGANDESLEDMIDRSQKNKKRSNASVFDVSGIILRMSLEQVEDAMRARKFTKVSEKYEIPNFIKWRNEEKCRNNGVVGYERLASCVVSLSKKDGHQYPETIKYSRFDTKEEIEVKLTSNFTNNKVYRVFYNSLSTTLTGNSQKALYLRNIKIYDFWKKINQKYGSPDNKDEVLWGLGGNKPYLKASSGRLLLEDPMLREIDYTRMSREDQKFINTDLYNF